MATVPSPLLKSSVLAPLIPITPKTDVTRRRLIILSYWIVGLLGVPYWWKSTSIERLELPTDRIHQWENKAPCYLSSPVVLAVIGDSGDAALIQGVIQHLEKELPTSQCVNLRVGSSVQVSEFSYDLRIGEETSFSLGRSAIATSPSSFNYFQSLESAKSVASTLLDLSSNDLDPRVVKFASTYKLVFSLLNQDSASGDAILEWDIERLLKRYIQPLLSSLAPLHNFTIETQIQYFAPLTINVESVSEESGGQGSTIDEDDLKAFVNPADWNMPSSENLDPIIQFILYVPSASNRPLQIKQSTGSISRSNAFITPQWGGVAIFNPPAPSSSSKIELDQPFRHFSEQLHLLLGVPYSPRPDARVGGPISQWQIDGMIRRRLEEATRESVETLRGIRQLVEGTPNMRVGEEVVRDVKRSLDELDLAEKSLSISPSLSLLHSATALRLSTKAYFNPTMLALLYFPDEHKYAVYTPFFGPIAVPLLAALFKEWKAWKASVRLA